MEYQDYYKVLDVSRNATPEEIKKQYRKLASRYHPDRYKTDSEKKTAQAKFQKIEEAYRVLKNPKTKEAYDNIGSNWKAGQDFTPPPNWEYQSFSDAFGRSTKQSQNESVFSDFFESLFGNLGGSRGGSVHSSSEPSSGFYTRQPVQQPGQDQHVNLTIDLESAFKGTTQLLSLKEPQQNPQTGAISYHSRQLKVNIPAGIQSGQQIRLQGQGGKGIGGAPNGNLYLKVNITPHPLFQLDHQDIYLTLSITPWEAALGAKILVPTLAGKVELSIPPGSKTDQKMRLKGKGLPGKESGDQYVILKIQTPIPKTAEQRKVYEEMEKKMPFNPREN